MFLNSERLFLLVSVRALVGLLEAIENNYDLILKSTICEPQSIWGNKRELIYNNSIFSKKAFYYQIYVLSKSPGK